MVRRQRVAIGLTVATIAAVAITVGTITAGTGGSSPGDPTATVTQKAPYGDPDSKAVINYDGEFISAPYRGSAVKLTAAEAVAAVHKNVSQGLGDLAPGTPRVALRLVTYNSAGVSGRPGQGMHSLVDVTNLPAYVIIYRNSPVERIGGRAMRPAPAPAPPPPPETTKCSFEGIVDANTGKVLTLNQDCG